LGKPGVGAVLFPEDLLSQEFPVVQEDLFFYDNCSGSRVGCAQRLLAGYVIQSALNPT